MPRFFFNLHDGAASFDDEGIELDSDRELHLYMLAMAMEVLKSHKQFPSGVQMEVLDGRGRIVRSLIVKTTAG